MDPSIRGRRRRRGGSGGDDHDRHQAEAVTQQIAQPPAPESVCVMVIEESGSEDTIND